MSAEQSEPCESLVNSVQCGHPDTQRRLIGCIHEHVRAAWVCPVHRDALDQGLHICRTCNRHPVMPHKCPLRGVAMPVLVLAAPSAEGGGDA